MQLEQLISRIEPQQLVGDSGQAITGLTCDSRQVKTGMMFFALPGVQVDGFDYVPQALEGGACAIVADKLPQAFNAGVCYIQVDNVRQAMALMAAEYYGNPGCNVTVVGVTGTNGKTTTTYLLEAMFSQAGYSPAVFGTIEYRFGNLHYDASHTTPESVDLLRMMAEFAAAGANVMILEVSSHALEQHRVDGIKFDAAVFTNLTQDHLDYHQTLERYFGSKKRLFTELLGDGIAVVNGDDSYGQQLLQQGLTQSVSYGNGDRNDYHPVAITVGREGISGKIAGTQGDVTVRSSMVGNFNVSNLLAATAVAQQLGLNNNTIAKAIANAPQVPGRVESIANQKGALVLVDYAHTPDALEQVLKTVAALDGKRILTLVGCGGDRDKGKRPLMAAAAVKYSWLTILTSDNPRTEDPDEILAQMRDGAEAAGGNELPLDCDGTGSGFVIVVDRRRAIELAAKHLEPGDILLVAGKGHEDYQIIGRQKIHFDDREELRRVFAADEGVASRVGA